MVGINNSLLSFAGTVSRPLTSTSFSETGLLIGRPIHFGTPRAFPVLAWKSLWSQELHSCRQAEMACHYDPECLRECSQVSYVQISTKDVDFVTRKSEGISRLTIVLLPSSLIVQSFHQIFNVILLHPGLTLFSSSTGCNDIPRDVFSYLAFQAQPFHDTPVN